MGKEQDNFDNFMRQVLSVSPDEIRHRMAEDKKAKNAAGLKRYPKRKPAKKSGAK